MSSLCHHMLVVLVWGALFFTDSSSAYDAVDLVHISRMLDGQIPPDTDLYDLDEDGLVTESDLAIMLREVHGLPQPVRLDSQMIGHAGGTVGTAECLVVIPPGAWSDPALITVDRLPEQEDPQPDLDAGTLYEVAGIPPDIAAPVEIRLPVPPERDVDGLMLDVGEFAFSTTGEGWKYQAVDGSLTNGQLRWSLPATPQGPIVQGLQRGAPVIAPTSRFSSDTNYTYRFRLVRYSRLTGERFDLFFPAKYRWIESYIYNVMYALEDAYTILSDPSEFKFSYAPRTSWPISVYFKDFAPKTSGDYISSNLGINYDTIQINTLLLRRNREKDARITAGHEFFHFVQACYQSQPRNLWIDEATATWFEKRMSGDANYVPPTFSSNPRLAVRGMHLEPYRKNPNWGPWSGWNTEDAGDHGYGMAAWIEFLSQQPWWTPGYLRTLYTEISNGTHPVAALVGTLGSPENVRSLWRAFCRAFFNNEVYPFPANKLTVFSSDGTTAFNAKGESAYGIVLNPRVSLIEDVARTHTYNVSIQQLGVRSKFYTFRASTMLPEEATFASEVQVADPADLDYLGLFGVLLVPGAEPESWSLTPVSGVQTTVTARSTLRLDMAFDRPSERFQFMVVAVNDSVSEPYDARIPVTWRTFMTRYPFEPFSVADSILGNGSAPSAIVKVNEARVDGDLGTVTDLDDVFGMVMDGTKGIRIKLPHDAVTNLTFVIDADFEPPFTRDVPVHDGTWVIEWQEDLGWRVWSNFGEETTAGPYIPASEAESTGLPLPCPASDGTAFHTVSRGYRAHVYWQPDGQPSPDPDYYVAEWDVSVLFVDLLGSEAPAP